MVAGKHKNPGPEAAHTHASDVAVPEQYEFPVSFAQQRLWFIDQLEGGSAHYNMPGAFKLTGKLKVRAFKQAIHSILERHEVLRTHFLSIEGEAQQLIKQQFTLPLTQTDLSHLDETQQVAEVKRLAEADALKPFDLSQDVLLRVQLLTLSGQEHVVLFNLHVH